MLVVHMVEAEHFEVPGKPTSLHATRAGADAKAAELVATIWAAVSKMLEGGHHPDAALPEQPSGDWQADLEAIHEALDATDLYDRLDADVWVTELEVQP